MTSTPGAYSDDLREYYFSNPPAKMSVETIEFIHPAFLDGDGDPTGARFVNDYTSDFAGTLESDAPLNGGEEVTFTNARFSIARPESNSPGLPTCDIEVVNVGRVLMDQIELAVSSPNPIKVIFREYLVDDPSAPGVIIDGLTLGRVNATPLRVTGTAGFEDDLNTPFGRKKYSQAEYPGLVR